MMNSSSLNEARYNGVIMPYLYLTIYEKEKVKGKYGFCKA